MVTVSAPPRESSEVRVWLTAETLGEVTQGSQEAVHGYMVQHQAPVSAYVGSSADVSGVFVKAVGRRS